MVSSGEPERTYAAAISPTRLDLRSRVGRFVADAKRGYSSKSSGSKTSTVVPKSRTSQSKPTEAGLESLGIGKHGTFRPGEPIA